MSAPPASCVVLSDTGRYVSVQVSGRTAGPSSTVPRSRSAGTTSPQRSTRSSSPTWVRRCPFCCCSRRPASDSATLSSSGETPGPPERRSDLRDMTLRSARLTSQPHCTRRRSALPSGSTLQGRGPSPLGMVGGRRRAAPRPHRRSGRRLPLDARDGTVGRRCHRRRCRARLFAALRVLARGRRHASSAHALTKPDCQGALGRPVDPGCRLNGDGSAHGAVAPGGVRNCEPAPGAPRAPWSVLASPPVPGLRRHRGRQSLWPGRRPRGGMRSARHEAAVGSPCRRDGRRRGPHRRLSAPGVPYQRMYSLVRSGEIPAEHRSSRWWVRRTGLDTYLERIRVKPRWCRATRCDPSRPEEHHRGFI